MDMMTFRWKTVLWFALGGNYTFDRIVHRFRHGTRTEEDKTDLRKRREIKNPVFHVEEDKKGEPRENLEKSESGKKNQKNVKYCWRIHSEKPNFICWREQPRLLNLRIRPAGRKINSFCQEKTTILRHGLRSNMCTGFNVKILEKTCFLEKSSGIEEGFYMINCWPVRRTIHQKRSIIQFLTARIYFQIEVVMRKKILL